MKTIITLLATAALATLTAGTAQAQTEAEGQNVTVRYGDLDLAKAAGVKVLDRRISRAAVAACGGQPDTRDLNQIRAFNACRKIAIGKAMTAVAGRTSPAIATR